MATFGRIRLLLATFWGYMQVREFLCGIFISTKFIFVFDTRSQQFGKCISVEYIFLGAQSIKQYFVWKKLISQPWESKSQLKHIPKKRVLYENLLIRNVAHTFLGPSIYVGTKSFHFPMKKFLPSPSMSPSPESHGLFEIWLKIEIIFWGKNIKLWRPNKRDKAIIFGNFW